MPLVQAKCTNCGGILKVDSERKKAECPHCHGTYFVEEAINNYNYINNYHIKDFYADVVQFNDERSAEQRLSAAEQHMKFKDWDKALEVFKEVCESKPQDYRCWWGCARAEKEKESSEIWSSDNEKLSLYITRVNDYFQKAIATAPEIERNKLIQEYTPYLAKLKKEVENRKEKQNGIITDCERRKSNLANRIRNAEKELQEQEEKRKGLEAQQRRVLDEESRLSRTDVPHFIEVHGFTTFLSYLGGGLYGALIEEVQKFAGFMGGLLIVGTIAAVVLNIIRVIIRSSMNSSKASALEKNKSEQASIAQEIKETNNTISRTKNKKDSFSREMSNISLEKKEAEVQLDVLERIHLEANENGGGAKTRSNNTPQITQSKKTPSQCENCHAVLKPGTKFCPKCGYTTGAM